MKRRFSREVAQPSVKTQADSRCGHGRRPDSNQGGDDPRNGKSEPEAGIDERVEEFWPEDIKKEKEGREHGNEQPQGQAGPNPEMEYKKRPTDTMR